MKAPVKDKATVPWMSKREIPVIKLVLSAWRKRRRELPRCGASARCGAEYVDIFASEAAEDLELIAAIDERLRKEAVNGKQS